MVNYTRGNILTMEIQHLIFIFCSVAICFGASVNNTSGTFYFIDSPTQYKPGQVNSKHVSVNIEGYTPKNEILLKDGNVTCLYSNLKHVETAKRYLRCNDTECVLNETNAKTTTWVCGTLKCYVKNQDFTKDFDERKALSCVIHDRFLANAPSRSSCQQGMKYDSRTQSCRPID